MLDLTLIIEVYKEKISKESDMFIRAKILNRLAEYCNYNGLDYLSLRKQIMEG
jgi:hypothetical protein